MREIFFKSELHKERFLAAMQNISKVYDGKLDQEYGAALYILTASNSMWQVARQLVDSHFIDFDLLLDSSWSGGQSVLIQLAGNLFNGQTHLDALELMRLDGSNYNVAISALHLRRDSYHINDFQSDIVDGTVVNTTKLLVKDVYALKPAMPEEWATAFEQELEEVEDKE